MCFVSAVQRIVCLTVSLLGDWQSITYNNLVHFDKLYLKPYLHFRLVPDFDVEHCTHLMVFGKLHNRYFYGH